MNCDTLPTMDDVELRAARAADADAIADVYLASIRATYDFPLAHSDEQVRRWIAGVVLPTQEVWVAVTASAQVVALLALTPDMIDQLYVAPEWTGRGAGSRLVALAKAHRPGGLDLYTFQVNARARRFYARHGFVEVELGDGSGNEEGQPDVRCAWRATAAGPESTAGPVAWDGQIVLTTARLLLRTFRLDDLPPYAALNADPEVVRHLGGMPLSREYSDDIAAWAQRHFAEDGFGLLAIERRADGAFLGMCGLHHPESYPEEVEIGWRLARGHWGCGYATEAAAAWLDFAFDTLGLPRVISMTVPLNQRSLAVMERLGMAFDHEADIEDDGLAYHCAVYSLTAERWRSRRRQAGAGAS
jgi:RimJ/RimL family protein N-acetyltransferase